MTAENPTEPLLTPAEAARRVNVSLSAIYKWASDGTLPSFKVGEKSVRIKESDVNALIQRREHPELDRSNKAAEVAK